VSLEEAVEVAKIGDRERSAALKYLRKFAPKLAVSGKQD